MMEFVTKEQIQKGWSDDRKYKVADKSGGSFLLRVYADGNIEKHRAEFELMQKIEALGVPICRAIEFGECGGTVYAIQSWIDGVDAEEYIKTVSNSEAYGYGLEAGRMLKAIHSVPAPLDAEDWELRYNRKIDTKIAAYSACPLKYDNDAAVLAFIASSRHLLKGRPQAMHHGDYHIGNMMIDSTGRLTVIDFNRFDWGDPWEEFNRIAWSAQCSGAFASGCVDGYFGGDVPDEFWRLLALYISCNTLSSLYWAIPFGEGEIQTMRNQYRDIMEWYDYMKNYIPKWYSKQEAFPCKK